MGNSVVVGFDSLLAIPANWFHYKERFSSAAGRDVFLTAQRGNSPLDRGLDRGRGGKQYPNSKSWPPNIGLGQYSSLCSVIANTFGGQEKCRHHSSVESHRECEYLPNISVAFVDACPLNLSFVG
jgi:hypothetical protein